MTINSENRLFPINLRITDKLCVVVGGGRVAARKVARLLEAGGRVRIISPELCADLASLAEAATVEWLARGYAQGDLAEAFLGFAMTDHPQTQQFIAEDASRYGVLLNSGDDPAVSNFHVPAHFRRGEILVTVSSGGNSPALSRRLRQHLETEIHVGYGSVATLLGKIRAEVTSQDGDSEAHARLFNRLLDDGLPALVMREDWFAVQMLLLARLPSGIDSAAIIRSFLAEEEAADRPGSSQQP